MDLTNILDSSDWTLVAVLLVTFMLGLFVGFWLAAKLLIHCLKSTA